jgi:hypothetical protein
MQTLNWITSWMPAGQARVHPPLQRQYKPPDSQDWGVPPVLELMELLWLIFQVLTWRNLLMATCTLLSWIIAKQACRRILKCHLDNHCNCRISCWDRHRDPHCGWIFCFSWCWKEAGEVKCGAFLSWFKKEASDKYKKLKEWRKEMWMNVE